jgi:hypothetical protein
LEVFLAFAANAHFAPFGQGIDRRNAHAVQAAGDFVAGVAKFAARVQDGHDHFERGFVLLRMNIHRDAAAVVFDGNAAVFVDDNDDAVACAGQGFVDGIVDDLIHQMVEGFDVCAAHVHARAAAHSFQAFQNLDILCTIRRKVIGYHENPPRLMSTRAEPRMT